MKKEEIIEICKAKGLNKYGIEMLFEQLENEPTLLENEKSVNVLLANIENESFVKRYNIQSELKVVLKNEVKKLLENSEKLEVHQYAPELNKLILKNGSSIPAPNMLTIENAISYIVNKNLRQE